MAPTTGTLREFRDALHALSADPGATNVDRYLAASRALGGPRRRPKQGSDRRPRVLEGESRLPSAIRH